jgi:FAD/FMN-containing dehydrogenase
MSPTIARMKRRTFIERVGVGTTALLAGCGTSPSPTAPATPPPSTTLPPSPSVAPSAIVPAPAPTTVVEAATPATEADWGALAASLEGHLVRPGASEYALAHQLYDPRFDDVRPQGIAYCASEADVQRCIAFARAHALAFTARCGGHSYAGYSTCTGLVCDVGPMSTITVDDAGNAIVGAGAKLIDLYAALGPRNLAVPGGTCPSVGIAGLALGGGQGVLGRKLGLTCDAILGVRLVTADGLIRVCDATSEPELYWASRGGGGGNFGVVTQITFRTAPVGSLVRFSQSWPWAAAADVMRAWQAWGPSAPDELWSKVHFNAAGSTYGVGMAGVYAGSEAELRTHLAALDASIGRPGRSAHVATGSYLETMLIEASCNDRPIDTCHLPSVTPTGTLGRRDHVGHSDFFSAPLSSDGIAALISSVEARGADPLLARGAGGISFDALGGAINRVAPDATAFFHRSSLFLAQYSTHWAARSTGDVIAANVAWLDRFHDAMRPSASGFAYLNYIDDRLPDWERAYYGDNLARLRTIKAHVDPSGFFRFAQAIPA